MEGRGHDLKQRLPSTMWVVLLTHKHYCLLTTSLLTTPSALIRQSRQYPAPSMVSNFWVATPPYFQKPISSCVNSV